jgi:hypothetical protein
MNTPGFTAEAAIDNRPASFHRPGAGTGRSAGGAVTMAITCPEECPCVCGEGAYGKGHLVSNQAA